MSKLRAVTSQVSANFFEANLTLTQAEAARAGPAARAIKATLAELATHRRRPARIQCFCTPETGALLGDFAADLAPLAGNDVVVIESAQADRLLTLEKGTRETDIYRMLHMRSSLDHVPDLRELGDRQLAMGSRALGISMIEPTTQASNCLIIFVDPAKLSRHQLVAGLLGSTPSQIEAIPGSKATWLRAILIHEVGHWRHTKTDLKAGDLAPEDALEGVADQFSAVFTPRGAHDNESLVVGRALRQLRTAGHVLEMCGNSYASTMGIALRGDTDASVHDASALIQASATVRAAVDDRLGLNAFTMDKDWIESQLNDPERSAAFYAMLRRGAEHRASNQLPINDYNVIASCANANAFNPTQLAEVIASHQTALNFVWDCWVKDQRPKDRSALLKVAESLQTDGTFKNAPVEQRILRQFADCLRTHFPSLTTNRRPTAVRKQTFGPRF